MSRFKGWVQFPYINPEHGGHVWVRASEVAAVAPVLFHHAGRGNVPLPDCCQILVQGKWIDLGEGPGNVLNTLMDATSKGEGA